jgi:hypothetical protein
VFSSIANAAKKGVDAAKNIGSKAKQGFDSAKQGFDSAKQGFDSAKELGNSSSESFSNTKEAFMNNAQNALGSFQNLADVYINFLTPGSNIIAVIKIVLSIIKEIIRILIIYFIAIPIGITLCLLYFLWISIITNINIIFSNDSITNVINFVRDDSNFKEENQQQSCDVNLSFWQSIIKIFNVVINRLSNITLFIFNNLPLLVVVFYCLFIITHSLYTVNNNIVIQFINILHIIMLATILLLFTNVIFKSYRKINPDASITTLLFDPPIQIQQSFFYFMFIFSIILLFFMIFSYLIVFFRHNLMNISNDAFIPIFTTIIKYFNEFVENSKIFVNMVGNDSNNS